MLPEDVIYTILLYCDIKTVNRYCLTAKDKKLTYLFYHQYSEKHKMTIIQPQT